MKEAILILTFGLFFLRSSGAFAGGGQYYLPSPEGGCFAIDNNGQAGEADFINHRKEYSLINKNDQLVVFNACNERRALCIKIPVMCGNVVYEAWFWRIK